MVAMGELSKIVITFLEKREELDRIEAAFTKLKSITGLKKIELYGKALEWIAKDQKAKSKFMEYLPKQKGQEQQLVINK
jgi:hypothetical protein